MSLSLYEGKRRREPVLVALVVANLLFAGCTVFLWALMAFVMAEPIRWATARGVGTRPELFDYPFVLLWLIPVAGACAAWIALRAERLKLAYFVAFYPLLYFGLVAGWYYVAPTEWH